MAISSASGPDSTGRGVIVWPTNGAPFGQLNTRWEITHGGGVVTVTILATAFSARRNFEKWFVFPSDVFWVEQEVSVVQMPGFGTTARPAEFAIGESGAGLAVDGALTLFPGLGSLEVTGHPGMVIAGGVAVADPYWNNVSFLIGYDGDPVVDEGPRRVTVTDVATPTRTVPAVGSGGGAYNQTSTSSYRNWVTADRLLDGARPGKFYWEFEANPSGPAQFSGCHGVVSRNQLDDPTRTYDSGNDPFYHGSLVYRGSGDTQGNGTIRKAGTNSYGAGDVVMIAFEPHLGKFWVGLNGTWEDDPTVDPPTRTSDDAGGDFWPVLQAREPGEGGTLRSVASQFSYAVPTGCTALGGEVIIPPGATVSVLNEYGIVGVTRGAAVFGLNEYDIVGVTRGAAVFGLNEYDIVGVTRGAAVFGLNEYVILE